MNDVPQCSPKQLPSEQSLSKEKQNITDGILHELGRLVNFGDVTVYEFELWLGDNPAVRDGCPVMLGKHCTDCYKVDINTFEAERASRRRHGKDLYIPVPDRTALLLSQGFMLDQIVTIVLEVEDIKKSRAESLRLNNWQKLNMVVGSAGKTLRKIVGANKNDTDKPNTVQARSA